MSSELKKQRLLIILIAATAFVIFLFWILTFNLGKAELPAQNKNAPQLEQIKQGINSIFKNWSESSTKIKKQLDNLNQETESPTAEN